MIKLYHFTGTHHLVRCVNEGISLGTVLKDLDSMSFIHGWQWLTANPIFAQSWNRQVFLKKDRCAHRLTVQIPKKAQKKLFRWEDKGPSLVTKRTYYNLSCLGDPECWFIYKGIIRPSWIKEITSKPQNKNGESHV